MKKTDQFELPFEGKSNSTAVDASLSQSNTITQAASIVCLSEKRFQRHVGTVYNRLVESGFAALPKRRG